MNPRQSLPTVLFFTRVPRTARVAESAFERSHSRERLLVHGTFVEPAEVLAWVQTGQGRLLMVDLHQQVDAALDYLESLKRLRLSRLVPTVVLLPRRCPRRIGACYSAGAHAVLVTPKNDCALGYLLESAYLYWLQFNESPLTSSGQISGGITLR
jgi:CheY-like chemotaxis protein